MKLPIERLRCCLVVAALAVMAAADAQESLGAFETPRAAVAALHDGLAELATQGRSSPLDVERRYERLEPLILATHDLPYIARFALGRHWRQLAEADQRRFVEAFERLSIMSYAARFTALGKDALSITGERALDGGRAQVSAAIARPGQTDIPLEYVLERRDGGWRIINVVADGVSDLALKRAEYQRIASSGSFESLLEHLEEQTVSLQDGAAQRMNR